MGTGKDCPSTQSSLSVGGVDTGERLPYHYSAYSAGFVVCPQRLKFQKIERCGHDLPALRRHTNPDIALPSLKRERVLAVVIRLIPDW